MPGGRSREQQLEAAVSYLGGHFYLQNGATGGCGDDDDDDDDEGTGSIIPDRTGKHSFCRLCLTHADKLNPLFPVNASPDRVLLAQILDCVEVQITLPDDIKALICNECVQQIYAFASFKELCKSNDKLLKSQTFAQESDEDGGGAVDDQPIVKIHPEITPEVTMTIPQPQQEKLVSMPDATLLEKLFEQGVQVEAIGDHQPAIASCSSVQLSDADEREAERKAKNAARMRRWRLRQRQKQEQQQGVMQELEPGPEKIVPVVVPVVPDPIQLEQEEALRMQQAKEMFALLAQQQLRQVEAEIRRLKAGVLIQEQIQDFVVKQEPQPEVMEENGGGESSRQTSPSSEQHMAAVRRSRAEYMRKWRAKRSQSQQQAAAAVTNNASATPAASSFGFVGRPPILSPAPGETEKGVIQRHNRAEYMRRWRRERLKQELSPSEFDDWCTKSEQRRRFREWQVGMRESASSAGDETMDCGELEASFRTAQS